MPHHSARAIESFRDAHRSPNPTQRYDAVLVYYASNAGPAAWFGTSAADMYCAMRFGALSQCPILGAWTTSGYDLEA